MGKKWKTNKNFSFMHLIEKWKYSSLKIHQYTHTQIPFSRKKKPKDFDYAGSSPAHGSQQTPLPQLHLLDRQCRLHQIDFALLNHHTRFHVCQYNVGMTIATLVDVRFIFRRLNSIGQFCFNFLNIQIIFFRTFYGLEFWIQSESVINKIKEKSKQSNQSY